jgi:hypothetical protein
MKGLLTSCCLHWKILAGLLLVGLIIGVIAPSALASAVPLLIVAICPLSMIYGMRGMMGGAHAQVGHMHGAPVKGEEPAGADRAAQLRAELERLESRAAIVAEQLRTSEARRSAPTTKTELSGTL